MRLLTAEVQRQAAAINAVEDLRGMSLALRFERGAGYRVHDVALTLDTSAAL